MIGISVGIWSGRNSADNGVLTQRDYQTAPVLGSNATFARSDSVSTCVDNLGLVSACLAGETRFVNARRLRNRVTNSACVGATVGVIGSGGAMPTNWGYNSASNGLTYEVISYTTHKLVIRAYGTPTAAAYFRIRPFPGTALNVAGVSTVNGTTWYSGVSCRLIAGNTVGGVATLFMQYLSATPSSLTISSAKTLTLDATTRRWEQSFTATNASTASVLPFLQFPCTIGVALDVTVEISNWMLRNATQETDIYAAEYVSTGELSAPYHGANIDGVKYFAHANGNSIDANGILTEAVGVALTNVGLLMEPARSNFCLSTDALASPATRNITTGGTGTYCFWVTGTASVSIAAGTATGTGWGTATAGNPVIVEITGTGTVVLTKLSGTLNQSKDMGYIYQLEKGAFPTSWIVNTGTSAARSADALSYASIATPNATQAVVNAVAINADNWDGVLDNDILGADGYGAVNSIKVYSPGYRP